MDIIYKTVIRLVLHLLFAVFLVGRLVGLVLQVSFLPPVVSLEDFPLGQLEFPALSAPLAFFAPPAQQGLPHLHHPPRSLRKISLLVRLLVLRCFPPLSTSLVVDV